MRMAATGLLLAMAVAFLVLRRLAGLHPAWGYALAFTEAAMVGGLADWFAVTALFRRPLGLPIPHTAIIPANKDRIADNMAAFLRDNFLTPQVVARRLQDFNLAGAVGAYMVADSSQGGPSRLRQGAAELLADLLQALDPEQLGGLVKSGLHKQLERVELAPLLGQLLSSAIAGERHQPVLDALIHRVARAIEENEELLRDMIHQRANSLVRWTGIDEKIATAVLDGLYRLLAECLVYRDHPVRLRLEEMVHQLADDLLHDRAMQERVEQMKAEVLASPAMGQWLNGMWERARSALLRTLREPDTVLAGSLGGGIAQLGTVLTQDERLQLLVNRFARRTLVGAASRYGNEIVRLVSETVKRWDARTVTDRIEGAVGRDLQFIRINGTLVGGMFGVVIHAVGQLL